MPIPLTLTHEGETVRVVGFRSEEAYRRLAEAGLNLGALLTVTSIDESTITVEAPQCPEAPRAAVCSLCQICTEPRRIQLTLTLNLADQIEVEPLALRGESPLY
ncbi:hypothetical protein DRO53_04565 [Candidatus Bathyarchaeota archaeon]|nr:MAG: hypothetical protein DRO53_04565 [Candidatus Bathyarchaeota archaeon]